MGENPGRSAVCELLRMARLAPATSHVQIHVNDLSSML